MPKIYPMALTKRERGNAQLRCIDHLGVIFGVVHMDFALAYNCMYFVKVDTLGSEV